MVMQPIIIGIGVVRTLWTGGIFSARNSTVEVASELLAQVSGSLDPLAKRKKHMTLIKHLFMHSLSH